MRPPAERDPRYEHHERKSVSPGQQSWLGLGTGMTEKVVGTLFATSAARNGSERPATTGLGSSRLANGTVQPDYLTVADHSGEVGDLAGSGVSANKNGGR